MKLITTQQETALCKGDIITRYPYNGEPEANFDSTRAKYIQTYEVRSVNAASGMLELVMSAGTAPWLALPWHIDRIFINIRHLAEQKIWWVDDTP